jgi:hypothetical protein
MAISIQLAVQFNFPKLEGTPINVGSWHICDMPRCPNRVPQMCTKTDVNDRRPETTAHLSIHGRQTVLGSQMRGQSLARLGLRTAIAITASSGYRAFRTRSFIVEHPVQPVDPFFLGQLGESSLQLEPILYYSTVDPLWARHPPVRNHLVELCHANANIARRFIARHAAWRVGEGVWVKRHHLCGSLGFNRYIPAM